MSSSRSWEGYWTGARLVAPLALAIGALGVVFGYIARKSGLTAGAAIAMSATAFAGSPQFAALSVFTAGGSLFAAAAAAAGLATRFGAMSIVAAPALEGPLWKRLLLSQLVVDETWAVAYSSRQGFDRELLIGAGVSLYVVHTASTAIGATIGNLVGTPEKWGVDAVSPALFVILMAPRLDSNKSWLTIAVAAVVSIAAIPFAPPGIPILLAMAVVPIVAVLAPPADDRGCR